MMKPEAVIETDLGTDTEKYNGASLSRRRMKNRNHKLHRFFYSCFSWIIFIAVREAIRHGNGVTGQWIDKKIFYYNFPPAIYKFPPLTCTFPPFK
jgi:hypothetical protein